MQRKLKNILYIFKMVILLFTVISTTILTCLCFKKIVDFLEKEDEKYAQMSAEFNRDIKYYYGYK